MHSGAATSPMTIAQPNSAMVGDPTAGRSGMAREKVPKPVSESRPVKISAPTPAPAGRAAARRWPAAPPRPEASSSRNAPASGVPSSVLIAAKLPVARDERGGLRGHVAPDQRDGQVGQAAAERDQRHLRPDDGAQPDARPGLRRKMPGSVRRAAAPAAG